MLKLATNHEAATCPVLRMSSCFAFFSRHIEHVHARGSEITENNEVDVPMNASGCNAQQYLVLHLHVDSA